MRMRNLAKTGVLLCLLSTAGCGGGWQLGIAPIPIGQDGVYICYFKREGAIGTCAGDIVRLCNGSSVQRTARVSSYYQGAISIEDELTQTVTVAANVREHNGGGPFLGYSEGLRMNGVCSVRHYRLTVQPTP